MVPELNEGADMALSEGSSSENRIETVQKPYLCSEADCSTVAKPVEEILQFSSPADAESTKDKESLEAEEQSVLPQNGQGSTDKCHQKSRNNITNRVSRPPAILIPRRGDRMQSNNGFGFPPTLTPSPSKPLDPNAPEFTPSPRLSPCLSTCMSPLGFPGGYFVGSGVEILPNQSSLWSPTLSTPQSYGYTSPRSRPSGLAPQTPTEQVSRSLLLSKVAIELDEETLKKELSVWGHIHCMELGRRSEGIVIVHYYDIRNSREAFNDIMCQNRKSRLCEQSMTSPTKGLIGGKSVCVQYTHTTNCSEYNQGTLLVNNLDADVSVEYLRTVFGRYGCVKEVRGSPPRTHKFVEFYDTRDAEKAMVALGGKEIYGKRAKIEFCRARSGRFNSIQNGSVTGGARFHAGPWSPHEHQQGPNGSGVGTHPYGQMEQLHSKGLPSLYGGSNGKILHPYIPNSPSKEFHSADAFSPVEGSHHSFNSRTGLTPTSTLCSHYIFNEKEVEVNQGMPRTTLMVRNIPNKYSQPDFIKLLDEHCLQVNCRIVDSDEVESSYDFVYLPIDFKNRCNLGYGFVNFTSVEATLRFYKDRHSKMWERFNSNKVCEISYARLQGLAVLKEHFQNSVFICSTEKFLPAIYDPPRNGVQCTPPTFAAGHLNGGRRNNSFSCSTPGNVEDSSIFGNGGNEESAVGSDDMNTSVDHKVTVNQSLKTSER